MKINVSLKSEKKMEAQKRKLVCPLWSVRILSDIKPLCDPKKDHCFRERGRTSEYFVVLTMTDQNTGMTTQTFLNFIAVMGLNSASASFVLFRSCYGFICPPDVTIIEVLKLRIFFDTIV